MYIRKRSLRFSFVFLFLLFCLVIFTGKLLLLQIFRGEHLARLAEKQHNFAFKLEPIRGTIYDRELRPLAINVAAYSLYANPRSMSDEQKSRAISELTQILGKSEIEVANRINRDKLFIWIERKLSLDTVEKIRDLKLHGIDFIKESKRYYPNQSLASHVIGFAGMDNQGLEGMELKYDQYLKGESGWSQILRDARQRELLLHKDFIPPKDGFHLVLTVDETIQYIAEKALDKAYLKYNAKSATIVVMNPKTGEILALANRPTYNLETFNTSKIEERTNRSVAYVYEPGSVFKIVAAGAALEEDLYKETDKLFCENGEYKIGNHILHDHHPLGDLTFQEVFEKSSNICTAKIAQKMGANTYFKYAQRFRFGKLTGIDLAGEVDGWLKPPSQWSKTTISAIPMGHEVTVTPMQLLGAIGAIANDGVYMKPFVLKYIKDDKDELIRAYHPKAVDRVLSPGTARRLQVILQGVVDQGTGKKAQIEGVAVAGKTGTAQKVVNGQYSHNSFYASFIGFAPVDNPQLAVVVVVDEPRPAYYGGTVAAPVFQEVVSDSLRYLEAKQK